MSFNKYALNDHRELVVRIDDKDYELDRLIFEHEIMRERADWSVYWRDVPTGETFMVNGSEQVSLMARTSCLLATVTEKNPGPVFLTADHRPGFVAFCSFVITGVKDTFMIVAGKGVYGEERVGQDIIPRISHPGDGNPDLRNDFTITATPEHFTAKITSLRSTGKTMLYHYGWLEVTLQQIDPGYEHRTFRISYHEDNTRIKEYIDNMIESLGEKKCLT